MSESGKLINQVDSGSGDFESSASGVSLVLGDWVLVRQSEAEDWLPIEQIGVSEEGDQWFGCINKIGSNFIQIQTPPTKEGSYSSRRVHKDEFWSRIKIMTPSDVSILFSMRVQQYKNESDDLLEELRVLSRRLGLNPANLIEGAAGAQEESSGRSLSVLNAQDNITQYQMALKGAKDKGIPEIFSRLKVAHSKMYTWMSAASLPLVIKAGDVKGYIGEIEDKLLNLDLYAGLSEKVVKCREGEPAPFGEKLRVMQRRLYMDEECLAAYQAGGMRFGKIAEFDEWLSKPENMLRLLPFPRTVVAFQVRRKPAERKWDGSMFSAFVQIALEESDKLTFMYIRNGDQLWRLNTSIVFEENIFPDGSLYDASEPMMARVEQGYASGPRLDQMITKREFDVLVEEHKLKEKENRDWRRDNPKKEWEAKNAGRSYEFAMPHSLMYSGFRQKDWHPVDKSSVFYDECMEKLSSQVKKYNRIATILQGIFDRSDVLHPHPPVQLWTAQGFMDAIELIFDASMVIDNGEKPDFLEFQKRCNAKLGIGSVIVGQEKYWKKKEAIKEMARRQADWRLTEGERYRELEYFHPHGNPGPGLYYTIEKFKPGATMIKCDWEKERWVRNGFKLIKCTINVPVDQVLNISAYQPGDFKRFFADHRTRAEYMSWAPMLLAAEDWWANAEPQK